MCVVERFGLSGSVVDLRTCAVRNIQREFRVAQFLETYELSAIQTEFSGGYNWDRPCTFIDDDVFAVIVDKPSDDVDSAVDGYFPLWFYRMSEKSDRPGKSPWLNAHRKVTCEAFGTNKYGEVSGDLYYDSERISLVAISDRGGFRLTLDGATLAHDPQVARTDRNSASDVGFHHASAIEDWKYSVRGRCFYRFDNLNRKIDCRPF